MAVHGLACSCGAVGSPDIITQAVRVRQLRATPALTAADDQHERSLNRLPVTDYFYTRAQIGVFALEAQPGQF